MNQEDSIDRRRLEWLAVGVVTLIGACLRSWPIGRLGLTHFDEGIYALASCWSLQPRAAEVFAERLIPYAPPGFPILGGLAYAVLGRSDLALILISQVAGTLTIAVVAWLGRRTFGPGAGFASALFCAFSGSQIAFSRMALTDASFLLVWLLAIGAGMRFLERPGLIRAIVMGLAVGLAQEFKYNGWLTGGIVIGSALVGIATRLEERERRSIARTFGWGLVAAGVAWLVVWPWFAFVDGHGGYSALLRHQQSYLNGWGSWWPNFLTQADQAIALSGGDRLLLPCVLLGFATIAIVHRSSWIVESATPSRFRRIHWIVVFALASWLFVSAPYWLGLVLVPWLLSRPDPSKRVIGVWWLVLSVLTPLYHPYARLWLPYHAVNWLMMGGLIVEGPTVLRDFLPGPDASTAAVQRFRRLGLGWVGLFALGAFAWYQSDGVRLARPQPDLLAPSDSLRLAAGQISTVLPDEVRELRTLVRPPLHFALNVRANLSRMSGSDQLREAVGPGTWALVDSAILRSDRGGGTESTSLEFLDQIADRWEIVQTYPTTLSLPTLLDLDPGAARSADADRTCRVWLLRPRAPGAAR